MAEKKARRYSVPFEHFENAMLAESRLAWEMLYNERHTMPQERREKFVGLLKRFVNESKPELDRYKEKVLAARDPNNTPGIGKLAERIANGPVQ